MLFNSLEFILIFLPLCVVGFYLAARLSQRLAIALLLLFSLIFYGVWNPIYLLLLGGSIIANYALGQCLQRNPSKMLAGLGVSANLLSIAYFKYMDFFIETANQALSLSLPLQHIILPLGISFFTFQQISYLVECYKGSIKEKDFLSYALFVSFFPQLIAGPIVRFQEISYQFLSKSFGQLDWNKVILGLIVFTIGLSKKVLLADNAAYYASDVFARAEYGLDINTAYTWFGVFAYSFQIYLDFSAYSDMAIGLALMLGLKLPVNFLSPYKSKDIISFWRTWHITLSKFLRDYLYIPLGGNRHGKNRRYINLMLVMLIGGLWHGASFNFVIWGGLHGLYLIINHLSNYIAKRRGKALLSNDALKIAVTFLAVTLAWIFFRAETFQGALHIYMNLLPITLQDALELIISLPIYMAMLLPQIILIWCLPNTIYIKERLETALQKASSLTEPRVFIPYILTALGLAMSIFYIFAGVYSEFIYFQF